VNKNNQENNNIIFGRLEGLRNTKRGLWACFGEKSKKGESFLSAGSTVCNQKKTITSNCEITCVLERN